MKENGNSEQEFYPDISSIYLALFQYQFKLGLVYEFEIGPQQNAFI